MRGLEDKSGVDALDGQNRKKMKSWKNRNKMDLTRDQTKVAKGSTAPRSDREIIIDIRKCTEASSSSSSSILFPIWLGGFRRNNNLLLLPPLPLLRHVVCFNKQKRQEWRKTSGAYHWRLFVIPDSLWKKPCPFGEEERGFWYGNHRKVGRSA